MTKTTKTILIVSAGVGFVAGIIAKTWYDRETKKEE